MPSFKIIVGTLFGLLISAILVLGIISYQYNEQVVRTSFWINHAHQVIEVADEISLAFRDLQLESNVIYTTRDTSRLSKYQAAREQIFVLLDQIRNLTRGDREQQGHIDSLTLFMPGIMSFADSGLPFLPATDALAVDKRFSEAARLRDRITALIMRIKKSDLALLRDREEENSRSIASFNRAFGELLVGTALLIIAAFFSIRYNFNRLLRIDEQLRQAQEVTEKALTAEIELNKLKSNFVALASHEFRTPLTTILSSASLLENYASGENQQKAERHISRIKSSVNNLTTILNEFLSVSKIEEGRVVPNIEQVDLKLYLEGCIANLQNFAKPGQKIIHEHTGPSEADTDPVFINNILNNLVSNAIKYSPENSIIYVASRIGETILILVKDDGIGIPEVDQKHLFERFYRASNAGNVQGTGLGLHIMRHYVEQLNGTVKIESEVGKGTTVEVDIPLNDTLAI